MHGNNGKKRTDEMKEKYSLSHLGKIHTIETRIKMSKSRLGHLVSEETRKKISEKNTGKIRTEATRKRLSDALKGKAAWNKGVVGLREHASPSWKGENAKYGAIHEWIRKKLGTPKFCECCGRTDKKKYEWCNINHKYKRDINDWMRLCTKCHRKYDYTHN